MPGLGRVARENECPAQLQVRQGAYRIGQDDATVIEDFLKFGRCLLATSCCKVRLAAYIRCIEASELAMERRARHREVVGNRPLQSLDRLQRRPLSECGKSAQRGKILELHRRILRESFLQ